ncbi:glucose-dependent insulinotropic receptor [Oenanthe melanoleuca]|uniref:glucose-dependent insulinotropic receptor n=1 Tax=Oenanthe melanoleuca TaxID=2939378 RepID=UPI0024C19438|nr:glucose-dependent insulinotropic receptor [Oenanthe melanoleuca]
MAAEDQPGGTAAPWCASHNVATASRAMGAILAALASLILAANVPVAVVLLCHIHRSGSKGLCFVLNLALADAMVGFAVMGVAADELSQPFYPSQNFCVLRMAFVTSACAASILSLILVACDRHLAIRKPFHYLQLVTALRVGLCLLALWLLAAAVGFLPVFIPRFQRVSNHWKCSFFNVFQPSYMLTLFCLGFFPALFLFLYLYCDMLQVAWGHVRHIQRVKVAGLAGRCPPGRASGDMKAMRTVAALIGCFTASWLPFFIASVVQMLCPECFPYRVIENFLWLLGLGNSLLNPLLYSYWQRDVQLQLSQLAAALKRRVLLHLGRGRCFPGRDTKALPAVSCLELQD